MSISKKLVSFAVANRKAGAIDVGSRSHWVSIGEGEEQIREFGVFTDELHQLCQWLSSHKVETIAMESTGFYWKQLFLMLQSYGMEPILVNASFTKNVKGRKPSDKADSLWIWKLHSAGLLPASFQPDFFTEQLRTYVRHRKELIKDASRCVNKMQKCLVLMNIHLPVVLSDIVGKSGRTIIEAILAGERNGKKLAKLADKRVKATKSDIARALTGFWKEDCLFELRQHWLMYNFIREQLSECDAQIDGLLAQRVQDTGQNDLAMPKQKKKLNRRMTQPLI